MFKPFLATPENPEPSVQQPVGDGSKRRFGKKIYTIVAALFVVVIAVAFLFSNFSGATVPLNLNYEVGEHMVYDSSWSTTTEMENQTLNLPVTQTTSSNATLTIDVLSLNGDTYTLNNTYNFDILGKAFNANMTQQLTKADYANNFLVGDAARLLYNMTGEKTDYYKLNMLQATIGESIQIPINTGNQSIGTTGTLNVKFASIEEITVPAGTFKVLRLDYNADFTTHANLQGIININLPEPVPGQITGQTYLEYGTCRLIKSTVTETNQFSGASGYNYTYTSERTLTQFTKP